MQSAHQYSHTHQPTIKSRHLIGRVPREPLSTTEFFLVEMSDGRIGIQKRLIPQSHKLPKTLAQDEREKTQLLRTLDLAVAPLMDVPQQDIYSVTTEFAGHVLRTLVLHPSATAADVAGMFAAATRSTAPFAKKGVLILDWAARNTGFGLSNVTSGFANFDQVTFFDHALTVVAGATAPTQTSPLWIGMQQTSLAPEIADALRLEQLAATDVLAELGSPVANYGNLSGNPDCELWYMSIDISASSLQRRIRDGHIVVDQAMQYSIGQQALYLLSLLDGTRPDCAAAQFFRAKHDVWKKMMAPLPSQRYGSLLEAADNIQEGYKEQTQSSFALDEIDFYQLLARLDRGTEPGPTLPAGNDADFHWREEHPTPRPDSQTRELGVLSMKWQALTDAGRLAASFIGMMFMLTCSLPFLLPALHPIATPEMLATYEGLEQVRHAGEILRISRNIHEQEKAAATLMRLMQAQEKPVRTAAAATLHKEWIKALTGISPGLGTTLSGGSENYLRAGLFVRVQYPEAMAYSQFLAQKM